MDLRTRTTNVNFVALKKTAVVTSAGSGKMPANEISVHKTYKENGEEGLMRMFVYVKGEKIADHMVEDIQDALRIKENYESSLNTSFEFTYTTSP